MSAWLADLLKLAQAGIEEEVQLSFINTAGTFNLTSDHIIYLRDLGVSTLVITAMIQHDWDLATGVRQVPASAVPPLAPEVPAAFGSHTPPPVPSLAQPITSSTPTAEAQSAESAAVESPPTEELNRPEPLEEPACSPTPQMTLAPVRAPYPVKLTDPIIVLRGAGRMPNTMLLESFP